MSTSVRLTDLPERLATDFEPHEAYMYLVDTSNTDDHPDGTSYKISPRELLRASIPSADYLSQGTNLQSYLDTELLRDDRVGPILLPVGDITFSAPLTIFDKMGVHIAGAGGDTYDITNTNGWDNADVKKSTRLIYTGPNTSPAITFAGQESTLERFAVDCVNGGVGIDVTQNPPFSSNFLEFKRIQVHRASVGIRANDFGGINNADIDFNGCMFKRCAVGFQCEGNQNVAYRFGNMCYWLECPIGIETLNGGNVYVFGCATNRVDDTFLKITGGGSNSQPSCVMGLRLDRTTLNGENAEDVPLPTIVDMSDNTGMTVIEVRAINVVYKGSFDDVVADDDHYFFKVREGFNGGVDSNSELVIGSTNLNKFGERTRVHRIGAYNAGGTRVGYYDPDIASQPVYTPF